MKPHVVAIIVSVVLIVFALGLAAGIWFSQHYRIVPVSSVAQGPPAPFRPIAPPPSPAIAPPAPATTAPPEPASSPGPFQYHFVPGETLHYDMTAGIRGSGLDLGKSSGIGMDFGLKMALATENVDADGTGALRLDFTNVDMKGDFMGSPVNLHHGPDGTTLEMNGKTSVDTAQGKSAANIPQLAFFEEPVRMRVAPSGEILNLTGAQGLDQLLAPITRLSPQNSDVAALQPNAQWTSQFLLPLPGLTDGIKSTARNTFMGYEDVNGRQCAVVRQELASNQTGGTLSSPAGALGEALNLAMPLFDLTGANMIYFDVANGKLVRCDMDLGLNLKIGPALRPLADLMRMYGDLLDDPMGRPHGKRAQPTPPPEQSDDIGVRINGTLSLEE